MKLDYFKGLIFMPFIWVFSGLLFLKDGDKIMIAAILISIITTLLTYGMHSIKKNIHDKGLWIVLAMTTYTVFGYYYHGSSSREMRALLGATLLLLTFPRELVSKYVLKWLVFIGSITALCSAYYFSEYLHLGRDQWPINAIPRGTMDATIAVLALIFLLNAEQQRDKILLSISLVMAITAVVINQSRGVWLSLVLAAVIILLLKLKIKHINWKHLLITVVFLSIGFYFAQPKIQQRIESTKSEITRMQSGDFDTNIGARLQLWKAALKIIPEQPILGSGNEHKEILSTLAAKGEISESVAQLSHYHNQYLDRLVKSGAIGLILLLIIFIYPLFSALPGINQQINIAVVTVYAIAGLSDVPLNLGAPLFMYLLLNFTLKIKNNEASR